jgi:hypothetical protein
MDLLALERGQQEFVLQVLVNEECKYFVYSGEWEDDVENSIQLSETFGASTPIMPN